MQLSKLRKREDKKKNLFGFDLRKNRVKLGTPRPVLIRRSYFSSDSKISRSLVLSNIVGSKKSVAIYFKSIKQRIHIDLVISPLRIYLKIQSYSL